MPPSGLGAVARRSAGSATFQRTPSERERRITQAGWTWRRIMIGNYSLLFEIRLMLAWVASGAKRRRFAPAGVLAQLAAYR